MAKIKNKMTVSLEKFGKKAGEYALDEFEYKGLTIRQWADKITSGEYQPVKHGRWLDNGIVYTCSECNSSVPKNIFVIGCDFEGCPYCFSRMDGDSE